MRFLLDTCVISELVASQPHPGVVRWVDSIDEERLFLSVITIGEIKKGIQRLPDSSRKRALAEWLEADLLIRFEDRILAIDTRTMLVWGELSADLETQGRTMPAIDSLIAATALQGRLNLATRSEHDFANSGVAVINPWRQELLGTLAPALPLVAECVVQVICAPTNTTTQPARTRPGAFRAHQPNVPRRSHST
jgi:tRNA(fMet)-specific endonuclease VapC